MKYLRFLLFGSFLLGGVGIALAGNTWTPSVSIGVAQVGDGNDTSFNYQFGMWKIGKACELDMSFTGQQIYYEGSRTIIDSPVYDYRIMTLSPGISWNSLDKITSIIKLGPVVRIGIAAVQRDYVSGFSYAGEKGTDGEGVYPLFQFGAKIEIALHPKLAIYSEGVYGLIYASDGSEIYASDAKSFLNLSGGIKYKF